MMTMESVLQRAILIATLVSIIGVGFSSSRLLTLAPGKPSKCHYLNMQNAECRTSLYGIKNYSLSGWFYHEPFHSCRPVYSFGGKINCKENEDLPLTKDECDEDCADRCPLGDGSIGVCTMEEFCPDFIGPDPPTSFQRHCHAYNVKCCPKRTGPRIPLTKLKLRQKTEQQITTTAATRPK